MNHSSKNFLEITRGKHCRELTHVSRMKPYYDRKTILPELDHESESSECSDEDSVTIGCTLTFVPEI